MPEITMDRKLNGKAIRCLYEDCKWTYDSLGENVKRLREHIQHECKYVIEQCACGSTLRRDDMKIHHGSSFHPECQWQKITCISCDEIVVRKSMAEHKLSQPHLLRALANLGNVFDEMKKMKADVEALTVANKKLNSDYETFKKSAALMRTELETQISTSEARFEQRSNELLSTMSSEFIEFTVRNWSKIVLTSPTPGAPPSAAMYSAGTPVKAWGNDALHFRFSVHCLVCCFFF